ncbi:MAG: hypothetical protein ACRDTU_01820 [Micromonosporaceae bacterium]
MPRLAAVAGGGPNGRGRSRSAAARPVPSTLGGSCTAGAGDTWALGNGTTFASWVRPSYASSSH